MAKKKGLSRGLEHLFEQNNFDLDQDNVEVIEIDVDDLIPNPYQPRKIFNKEALEDLAQSIKEQGVFQPILVRRAAIGYEIISGERRYRASKLAGLSEVPAIIYDYDDKKMMEVALVENIQRENLNVVEEAKSYQMMKEKLSLTQNEIAQKVGKSRPYVANIMRVLKLTDEVLGMLNDEKLTLGHVKTLIAIEDEKKQVQIAHQIVDNNLNVREAEELINGEKKEIKPKKEKIKEKKEYKRLEEILMDKLDTKVEIKGKNKGKIVIEYISEEHLEKLLEELKLI